MKPNTRSRITASGGGVLTRAQTLALQKRSPAPAPAPTTYQAESSCYIQLRSRRLQKIPPPLQRSPRINKDDQRSTRESTPCDLIRAADTICTPASTTKQARSTANHRIRDAPLQNLAVPPEFEEVFTREAQLQQLHFIEKYNFDIANDMPLSGRYEWVRVGPSEQK